jgi:superfamily II DNA helicase RecQ
VIIANGSSDKKLLLVGPHSHHLHFDKVCEAIATTQKEMVASVETLLEGVPLEVKSRLHLARDLTGVSPASEPYTIFSNMQSKAPKYNFTRDPEADDLRLVSAQAQEAIIDHHGWEMEGRFSTGAESKWAWVQRVDALMRTFLFRNHLASGPPPRAPEHAAIQLARTDRCPHQVHIFKPTGEEDSHTALLTPVHSKTNQLLVTSRITPRTLDPFASRFVVDYMSVLRPLYEELLVKARGEGAVDEDALYVNEGRRLSDTKVRSAIEEGFRSHGMPGITISTYRQGVNVWMRHYIPPLMEEYEKVASLPRKVVQYYHNTFADDSDDFEEDADDTLDILAGHTTKTAMLAYGRHNQDHTFFTASLLREFGQVCQIYRIMYRCDEGLFARLQQKMKNDLRSYLSSVGQGRVEAGSGGGGGGDRSGGGSTRAVSLLAHAQQGEELAPINTVVNHGVSSGAFPGRVSTALSMPSPGPRAAVLPSTLPLEQQGIILANLGTLLGTDHPSFRSLEQAMAFYAMWQVKRNLLVVLPTGGGKSLLFLLLAKLLWRSKFVVVIVPLKGLAVDLVQRGRRMGVQAWAWQEFVSLWEVDRSSLMGGLLVVQHEYCHGDERFVMFLNWASGQQRLFAAVFDEVHLFHLYATSFRRDDLITPTLLPAGVPLIALSATLPPAMEGRVAHHLRLQNGAFERVYRTPTLAKHMRYEVVCEELPASSASGGQTSFLTHLDRVTIEYMSGGDGGQRGSAVEKGEGNKAKGKGIVFFNNKKTLREMAGLVEALRKETMSVVVFHGLGGGDVYDAALRWEAEKERAQAMEDFMKEEDEDGRCKWLFATSAGGTGIDVQGVRVVMIYEWCYGQLELYQMFGRCRAPIDASLPCLGIILTSNWAIVGLKRHIATEKKNGWQQNDLEEDMALRLAGMEAHRDFLECQRPQARTSGNGRRCLRYDLEEFNTGTGISCMTAGAVPCAVCCDILKQTRRTVGLHEPDTGTHTNPGPAPQQKQQQPQDKHLHQLHRSHTQHHQRDHLLSQGPQGHGHLQHQHQRQHHGLLTQGHQLPASVPPYTPKTPSLQLQHQASSTPRPPVASPGPVSPHLPTFLQGRQDVGSTASASSSSSSPPLRQQIASVERVNECIALLKELGQQDSLLRACFHCVVVTGHKWGVAGDDPSKTHSPAVGGYRDYILKCPQFRKGGPLYQRCTCCLQPAVKDHTCRARGMEGWKSLARKQAYCCPCCQLRDMPCFNMTDFHAAPDYAFGPPPPRKLTSTTQQVVEEDPKGCKLTNTDMYITTAVDLWAFKPKLMHFLLRHSVSYRRCWHSVFGADGEKQYGVDAVPLEKFYQWLYGLWFTQGGAPIRNCHALFILFVAATNRGKQKVPANHQHLQRFEEILDITLRE